MTILLRPTLVLVAVAVLNLGTLHSWGFYTPWAFAAVMVSLVAALAALRPSRAQVRSVDDRWWNPLVALALGLGVAAIFSTGLLYALPGTGQKTLWLFPLIILMFSIILACVGTWAPHRTRWQLIFPLMLVSVLQLGGTLRFMVLINSPEPVIDVFNLLRDGADHIIAGRNPYANDIISPYETARAEQFGVLEPANSRPAGYPPLPLILSVLPRLFGDDPRWSNVVGDLLAAFAIAVLGWRRNRPAAGLLVAMTYLNLPRAPFIIEQAWYEPMIAALLGLGLVLSEFDGWRRWAGYTFLGLGLTAKQFGLPLLLPLAVAHWRRWPLILLGLAVGGLVMLPWLLWSPQDFLDIVLFKHLGRSLQPQSITVGSFLLNEFGVGMPRIAGWGLAALAIIGISLITPRHSAATALGLGTALLAFCVFHTQGFPNYFYLVQYLWLFGFVGLLPQPSEESVTDVSVRPTA